MDSASSWIEVTPSSECCPFPKFYPNFGIPGEGQDGMDMESLPAIPAMKQALQNAEGKAELHRVLNAIQHSPGYGIYVCESFKDPRHFQLDDYWADVSLEAMGLQNLHRLVGTGNTPLTSDACKRLHHFSRLLSRLSQRIDRVVFAATVC
jgi:hypothetical protein